MSIPDGLKKKNLREDYDFIFETQNLSNTKYHIAFAKGSIMASVIASSNDTSATDFKTTIAIRK